MIVGFTGTQKGLTQYQIEMIYDIFDTLRPDEVHHGDCIGGDKDFDGIALDCCIKRVIHPPINNKKRAWCQGEIILQAKEYLERNRDIVNACDRLIAAPYQFYEQKRSGTWSTIRYASKIGKPIAMVFYKERKSG